MLQHLIPLIQHSIGTAMGAAVIFGVALAIFVRAMQAKDNDSKALGVIVLTIGLSLLILVCFVSD